MEHTLSICVFRFVAFLALTLASSSYALAPGEPAPVFRTTDAAGQSHTLSEYIGKWIVLEWFDPQCPEVQKYYRNDVMPKLQRHYRKRDVVWLTISSEGRNSDGYLEADEALAATETMGLEASAPLLLDTAGIMGRAYDAQSTPYICIINPHGQLIYTGALIDKDSPSGENYLVEALDAAMADEEITRPVTKPQGCVINY